MFRPQRTGRRRWLVATGIVLALTGASLVVATPAQAATSVTDGFEGNPYDRWTTQDQPGDSFVWLGNHLQRRTGTNGAYFDAPFEVPARAYRSMIVERPTPGASRCFAEAWMKAHPPPAGGTPRVRIVIRGTGAAEGIYIVRTTYDLTNFEYGRAAFANFSYKTANLTVDISVTGGLAYVDDVSVWCNPEIG
jgi:hypothetical protein